MANDRKEAETFHNKRLFIIPVADESVEFRHGEEGVAFKAQVVQKYVLVGPRRQRILEPSAVQHEFVRVVVGLAVHLHDAEKVARL